MFSWLQQTFVGEEVCVTSVGGYIRAHTRVVVSPDYYYSIIVGRIKNSVI